LKLFLFNGGSVVAIDASTKELASLIAAKVLVDTLSMDKIEEELIIMIKDNGTGLNYWKPLSLAKSLQVKYLHSSRKLQQRMKRERMRLLV